MTIVVVVFLLFTNIGLAFYLGDYFGEVSYGFFIVGFGYLLIGILLYILKNKWIKNPVSNFIISEINKSDLI